MRCRPDRVHETRVDRAVPVRRHAIQRLPDVGFTFSLNRRDWREALINFALFAVIAIPFGLITGFIKPSTALPSLLEIVGRGVFIFLFIALPEEILFRGVIHRYLERVLRWSQLATLILSSVIFGASHLNNPPNVGYYFILATIAGIFYGRTFRAHGQSGAGCHRASGGGLDVECRFCRIILRSRHLTGRRVGMRVDHESHDQNLACSLPQPLRPPQPPALRRLQDSPPMDWPRAQSCRPRITTSALRRICACPCPMASRWKPSITTRWRKARSPRS